MQILLRNGSAIEPYLEDLARLRITVFREFPYLYEGTAEYERSYIATYARSPDSLFVLAIDGNRVVGCSTGIPMTDESEAFRKPFVDAGWDPDRIFYFGESVLEKTYRGQGLGVRFFEEREAYARGLRRFDHCAFCAVERSHAHPLRPAGYEPLDSFWKKRGYRHHPELRTHYSWRDIDQSEETEKPMSFWLKSIG
ncbi:GNAT family N-acetyltransferase [Rhizobium alvei]|uniref:GNAT family N-acetyltransferase n=1 Tax=Rhizobium alvei TaxID=1132659 RepID=A0ABT8YK03_9HYPH|nr:GNAT family N-acetyltransferase [Rhizobium alvei]MDO6964036.1 GNAT family N-acetyltransferase [Rhizobium alvei]